VVAKGSEAGIVKRGRWSKGSRGHTCSLAREMYAGIADSRETGWMISKDGRHAQQYIDYTYPSPSIY
jgi:hypothetical protein